jgi:ATP phosphoribosyltransferase
MTQKQHLTIAISKGYLLNETFKILTQLGYVFNQEQIKDSRKLFAFDESQRIQLLFIRPWDVPVYVEHGAADLGVVGKDVLLEKDDQVLELLDLKFGGCSLILAGPSQNRSLKLHQHIRVATKYPKCCTNYFQSKGIQAQILKMYGAIELAPLTGLSDIICDLTASGQTLKENHLKIMDTVFTSTARLIANNVSMRFHYTQIAELTAQIAKLTNA